LEELTLSEMKENQTAILYRFTDLGVESKLLSMGVLPKSQIRIKRRNALGNTFIILVNERLRIALRKKEAECIILR
jgi:Fe2+ transport system protein FeoA